VTVELFPAGVVLAQADRDVPLRADGLQHQVLWDIVTPAPGPPAIIDVPLDVKTDAGHPAGDQPDLADPGHAEHRRERGPQDAEVHAMFADDPAAVCRTLKSGMEKWVIDAVEETAMMGSGFWTSS
jgi:hypothetical protein